MRKKIVAGNWKMNKNFQEGIELAKAVADKLTKLDEQKEVIVIPPFIHLSKIQEKLSESKIRVGAQNCHSEQEGAFTGEVSAKMLKSIDIKYCLVGHSERRAYNFENNKDLGGKIEALLENNINPIFCCGEQLEDRKTGEYFEVIEEQLKILWNIPKENFEKLIIAYEPVWAIGTGETATAEQAQEIHAFIRGLVEKHLGLEIAENISILYGGSCKPSNAAELFSKPDVDGGLIGGAALKAEDFVAIVNSFS